MNVRKTTATASSERSSIGLRTKGVYLLGTVALSFITLSALSLYAISQAKTGGVPVGRTLMAFMALVACVGAVAIAASVRFFCVTFLNHIAGLSESLASGSGGLARISHQITESGSSLSRSTTEQAAALQETVGTIGSVGALIVRNAGNARLSREYADASEQAATRGKGAMEKMLRSIDEISHSNNELMSKIDASNREIGDIVKMISEIEFKTGAINEIVFQTKLLSFNASVEAARAGEAGKGFSVVAEEVGALARMSGAAAKEISDILGRSVERVEGIAENMQRQVLSTIRDSKEKVERGLNCASQCEEALNGIIATSHLVNKIVGEIDAATQEQAKGVREVEENLVRLDDLTQQNALIALLSAEASRDLLSKSEDVHSHANVLRQTVHGPGRPDPDADHSTSGSIEAGDPALTGSTTMDEASREKSLYPETALVAELKKDHQALLGLLGELQLTGLTEEARRKIAGARQFLIGHGEKEKDHLYPILFEAASSNPKIKSIVHLFEKDMESVATAALAFLDRYSKPRGDELEFIKDCGRLLLIFRNRIHREETVLYPEFNKLEAQRVDSRQTRQAA